MVIDGKEIASQIKQSIRLNVQKMSGVPKVVSLMVGDNGGAASYLKMLEKTCHSVSFDYEIIHMPETVKQSEVMARIQTLNEDPTVHGILFQRPIPRSLDELEIITAISPEKDVDGTHPVNMGKLFLNEQGVRPCTPQAVLEILSQVGISLDGKHVVVIGRSDIVGKPLAMLLLAKNATVTICHSHTKHLATVTQSADIVIPAVGRPNFLTKDMVHSSTVVIDVGTNMVDGKLVGDADFEALKHVVAAITPVPGGVGPVTNAILMRNVFESYKGA